MLQVTADYIKNKTNKTTKKWGRSALVWLVVFWFLFFFHLDLQFWQ